MQAYNAGFAKVYNQRWTGFARQAAPLIQQFYENMAIGRQEKTLLDLCCGTGQLALHFLEQGYRVVGIDQSQPMLHYAAENAHKHVQSGLATFVHADVCNFRLDERFGLVVSTYDALNHLPNEQALKQCFQCTYNVCQGVFVFDLNTRQGFQRWNGMNIDDSGDALIIIRGIFDETSDTAWNKVTGFTRTPDGYYERCDETTFETVFAMDRVKEMLLEVGFGSVYFAQVKELNASIKEPERENRVFVIASV